MHCGVFRKIPCLAHPPCILSAHRASPHSTLPPIPAACWGHLGPSLGLAWGPCHLQSSYPVPAPRICFRNTSLSPHIQCAVHGTCLWTDSICLLCCACTSQPHSCCVLYKEGWHGTEHVFKVCRGEKGCENKLTVQLPSFDQCNLLSFSLFFFSFKKKEN